MFEWKMYTQVIAPITADLCQNGLRQHSKM